MCKVWPLLAIFISFGGAHLPGQEISREEILKAEELVVASRKNLVGQIGLSVRRPKYAYHSGVEGQARSFDLAVLGRKRRRDLLIMDGEAAKLKTLISTPSFGIRATGAETQYATVEKFSGYEDAAGEICDFRKLGIVPSGIETLGGKPFEDVFLSPKREALTGVVVKAGNANAWKVSYEWQGKKSRVRCYYILDRDTHMLPLEISVSWDKEGGEMRDHLRNSWELDASSRQWYPRKVVLQRTYQANVEIEEVVDVNSVDLTEPEPERFDLAGLGLEVGQKVYVDSRAMYWSGDSVSSQPTDAKTTNGTQRFLLLGVAAVLLVIGLIAVERARKA